MQFNRYIHFRKLYESLNALLTADICVLEQTKQHHFDIMGFSMKRFEVSYMTSIEN